jgi:hypothetical protein
MATPPVVPHPQWIVKRGGGGGGPGIGHRTLLLKDTLAGNNIADHVTAYMSGTARRFVGVLRIAITSDLVVRVNRNGNELITLTIPVSTAIDSPVESDTFIETEKVIEDGDVFSWDILTSDDSRDRAGVASFTLEWS